jgi:hypothetical protein
MSFTIANAANAIAAAVQHNVGVTSPNSSNNTENYLTYFGPKYQSKHLAKYLRYFARYLSSKYLR